MSSRLLAAALVAIVLAMPIVATAEDCAVFHQSTRESTFYYDAHSQEWEQCMGSGWAWRAPKGIEFSANQGCQTLAGLIDQYDEWATRARSDEKAGYEAWRSFYETLQTLLGEWRSDTKGRKVHGRKLEKWVCRQEGN